MTIKTKYEIGEGVYCVFLNNDLVYTVSSIKKILNIDIHVHYPRGGSLYYVVYYFKVNEDDYFDAFNEHDIFKTKEEAQLECDKRNGDEP